MTPTKEFRHHNCMQVNNIGIARLAVATLMVTILGCSISVKMSENEMSFCRLPDQTTVLSYRYEQCIRQQLMNRPSIAMMQLHQALSPDIRHYLNRRAKQMMGEDNDRTNCDNQMPVPYCKLLEARELEQNGYASKAHSIYSELKHHSSFKSVSLSGLLRTESTEAAQTVPKIPSHPDSPAARCKRQIDRVKPKYFAQTREACSLLSTTAPEVVLALAEREWRFGLHKKATSRLEAYLQSDPLNHLVRTRLSKFLFTSKAFESSADHAQLLLHFRNADRQTRINLVKALIETKAYGDAKRVLQQLRFERRDEDHWALTLSLFARQMKAEELRPNVMRALESTRDPKTLLTYTEALHNTPHQRMIDESLIIILKRLRGPLVIWNALVEHLMSTNRTSMANRILTDLHARFPNESRLHFLSGLIHQENGRLDLALNHFKLARALDPDDREIATKEALLLQVMGELSEAVSLTTQLVKMHPEDLLAVRRLCLLHLLSDNLEEAIQYLSWLTKLEDTDADLKLQYATALLRSGQHKFARDELVKARTLQPNQGDIWALLAIVHAELGETTQAQNAFKKALRYAPEHKHLRLAYARFLENESDQSNAEEQYARLLARFPTDLESISGYSRLNATLPHTAFLPWRRVLKSYGKVPLAEFTAQQLLQKPAIVLADERNVTVSEQGDLLVESHRSVLLTHESAIEKHQTVKIPYDGNHAPEIIEAKVINPEGEHVELAKTHVKHLNPNRGSLMYGDARHLIFTFPNLQAGTIITYRVRTRLPRKPSHLVWWDSYVLGNEVLTVSAKYSLRAPANMTFSMTGLGVKADTQPLGDQTILRTWSAQHIPSFRQLSRTNQPLPMIYITSFKQWSNVDTWYNELFTPATQLGEQLKKLAQTIEAMHEKPMERLSTVVEYVEQNIAYEGVEFGNGAYLPRPAESTWTRRKGDCKDMVALMVGLLRYLGIEAHPVLVRPKDSGPFMPYYPSPSQFSHVIAQIKVDNQVVWIDPTAKLGTLGALPAVIRNAPALVVDGQGGVVTKIPNTEQTDLSVHEYRTLEIDESEMAALRSNLTLKGDSAGWARTYLREHVKSPITKPVSMPGLLLGKTIIPDQTLIQHLNAANRPLSIQATGRMPLTRNNAGHIRIEGLLDPTESSFVALLNETDQVESPRRFSKTSVIRFSQPHRMLFPTRSLTLNEAINVNIDIVEKNQAFTIHVRLEVDHSALLALSEKSFFDLLHEAQNLMESPVIFIPLTQ